MGLYYIDYTYIVFILPAILISMFAQISVNSNFKKYSKVRNTSNLTGAQAAAMVIQMNRVTPIPIRSVSGNMNDHFDPSTNSISLSTLVYGQSTVTALCVAAHEAGHAVQYAQGYGPMKLRRALVPMTQITTTLAWPMVIIGLILPVQYIAVVYAGIACYAVGLLFSLVTLPVEFDASRRALDTLKASGVVTEQEMIGAKKVLRAAAFTYVAATFTAMMNILRLLIIASNRGRR